MTSPKTLLQLMWMASPALPVGGFSYSEGLESAVESGRVMDEASATGWLLDHLRLVLARADLAAMADAMSAWRSGDTGRVAALNDWVRLTRESSESAGQSAQMGRSLVDWLRNGGAGHDGAADARVDALAALRPAPNWPIAFALAAAQTDANVTDAMLAFAFGWAENMAQAAMKTVPLGQAAAQRMLAALSAAIPGVVTAAEALGDDQRVAFTPMLAVLSAQHETQYSRLFRS